MTDNIFVATKDNLGDNLLICWTGRLTGDHWNVVANTIHGSELHTISKGAKGDAELIANLLNWYYSDISRADNILIWDADFHEMEEKKKKRLDTLESEYIGDHTWRGQ